MRLWGYTVNMETNTDQDYERDQKALRQINEAVRNLMELTNCHRLSAQDQQETKRMVERLRKRANNIVSVWD